MILPIILSFLASLAAAVMAYGTDSRWAGHGWGLGLIMLSRRLQWPLIALSLILCLALFALVISGKRRVWWLIGLMPVLALFGHRFLTGEMNRHDIADVVDQPALVSAAEGTFVGEGDYVVGVVFNDIAYAYPYACLFETPVIVQSDRDQRLLLMWSRRANAATALAVAAELKARDLDIASEPADSLLVYNARRGEFIVGVTGKTPRGDTPSAVKGRLPVVKTTWRQWKQQQPQTQVMLPRDGSYGGVTGPRPNNANDTLVAIVYSDPPVALYRQHLAAAPSPLNVSEGGVALLVFSDAATGRLRAFDRHLEADLIPKFSRNTKPKRKGLFVDADTDSGWTSDGVAIDGPAKGKKLAPVEVQEDIWDRAARHWYPGLTIHLPPGAQPMHGG